MRFQSLVVISLLSLPWFTGQTRAEKNSDLKPILGKPAEPNFEDSFSGAELGSAWVSNKGTWKIENGAIAGREKKDDMHAAVLTLTKPHQDSAIRFSFRLDGATGFNLSLNHAKGHLFRIAIAPAGVSITKDKDKKDPASKPKLLGKTEGKFETGKWYTILVETKGDQVAIQTDNGIKLKAQEPSLNVPKTGYRFVTRNETLFLDDVKVLQRTGN